MKDELKQQIINKSVELRKQNMIPLGAKRFEFLGMRKCRDKDDNEFEVYEFNDKEQNNLLFSLYESELEAEVRDGVLYFWGTKRGLERGMKRAVQREIAQKAGQLKISEYRTDGVS